MRKNSGFTLIEIVMVIIIAGLLATYALPRFFSKDRFENRGVYTEVLNAVRYAQQLAVAINCATRVELTDSSYEVTLENDGAACDTPAFGIPAPNPVTGQLGFNKTDLPVTITRSTNTFNFTALGEANTDVSVTIGGYSFQVIMATGYIQENQ